MTRRAIVIAKRERMPTGPKVDRNRGTVSRPASRRAIEKARP